MDNEHEMTSDFPNTSNIDYATLTESEIMEHLRDLSDLPSSLIVTNLSPLIFTDAHVREAFEKMFFIFDSTVTFDYLKNFKRFFIFLLEKSRCSWLSFPYSDAGLASAHQMRQLLQNWRVTRRISMALE